MEAPQERIDAAVARGLAAAELPRSFARSVRSVLFRAHDDWRVCCGSGCDPCVVPLGLAVDVAREELGWAPGDPLPA